PLYDVIYGCVPPEKPAADKNCFCTDARVAALGQAQKNTCSDACTDPADITALQTWFGSYCTSVGTKPVETAPTTTGAGGAGTGSPENAGGDSSAGATPVKQTW